MRKHKVVSSLVALTMVSSMVVPSILASAEEIIDNIEDTSVVNEFTVEETVEEGIEDEDTSEIGGISNVDTEYSQASETTPDYAISVYSAYESDGSYRVYKNTTENTVTVGDTRTSFKIAHEAYIDGDGVLHYKAKLAENLSALSSSSQTMNLLPNTLVSTKVLPGFNRHNDYDPAEGGEANIFIYNKNAGDSIEQYSFDISNSIEAGTALVDATINLRCNSFNTVGGSGDLNIFGNLIHWDILSLDSFEYDYDNNTFGNDEGLIKDCKVFSEDRIGLLNSAGLDYKGTCQKYVTTTANAGEIYIPIVSDRNSLRDAILDFTPAGNGDSVISMGEIVYDKSFFKLEEAHDALNIGYNLLAVDSVIGSSKEDTTFNNLQVLYSAYKFYNENNGKLLTKWQLGSEENADSSALHAFKCVLDSDATTAVDEKQLCALIKLNTTGKVGNTVIKIGNEVLEVSVDEQGNVTLGNMHKNSKYTDDIHILNNSSFSKPLNAMIKYPGSEEFVYDDSAFCVDVETSATGIIDTYLKVVKDLDKDTEFIILDSMTELGSNFASFTKSDSGVMFTHNIMDGNKLANEIASYNSYNRSNIRLENNEKMMRIFANGEYSKYVDFCDLAPFRFSIINEGIAKGSSLIHLKERSDMNTVIPYPGNNNVTYYPSNNIVDMFGIHINNGTGARYSGNDKVEELGTITVSYTVNPMYVDLTDENLTDENSDVTKLGDAYSGDYLYINGVPFEDLTDPFAPVVIVQYNYEVGNGKLKISPVLDYDLVIDLTDEKINKLNEAFSTNSDIAISGLGLNHLEAYATKGVFKGVEAYDHGEKLNGEQGTVYRVYQNDCINAYLFNYKFDTVYDNTIDRDALKIDGNTLTIPAGTKLGEVEIEVNDSINEDTGNVDVYLYNKIFKTTGAQLLGDVKTYAPEYGLGDVTGDGAVDILDVITVNKAVLGKESLTDVQNRAADVNKSGNPDSVDSLMILKKIVGLIDTFD